MGETRDPMEYVSWLGVRSGVLDAVENKLRATESRLEKELRELKEQPWNNRLVMDYNEALRQRDEAVARAEKAERLLSPAFDPERKGVMGALVDSGVTFNPEDLETGVRALAERLASPPLPATVVAILQTVIHARDCFRDDCKTCDAGEATWNAWVAAGYPGLPKEEK